MRDNLKLQFHQEMLNIYHRAREETSFTPLGFLQLVNNRGGLEAARKLINSNHPSEGYTKLWELGRLDLSVEAFVVKSEKFHQLFTTDELEKCKRRLRDYEYRY